MIVISRCILHIKREKMTSIKWIYNMVNPSVYIFGHFFMTVYLLTARFEHLPFNHGLILLTLVNESPISLEIRCK